eukprot:CAMPEP_0169361086 /NCGR_PEP_ID=MMETSP1017-20121227/30152_1 /TAXON_ID=342587 /ORGANISM="Karlodinium micrum, Strain CCMP2283" /LENGTH=402 /DNA_ID=CAMNT_0009458445 /DNA_START=37 /DNA_END=1243 /DNA_ORIENTATION=+
MEALLQMCTSVCGIKALEKDKEIDLETDETEKLPAEDDEFPIPSKAETTEPESDKVPDKEPDKNPDKVSATDYIDSSDLPPARDAFLDDQPDWKWEKERGQWKSYSLSESLMLEQYWQVFSDAKSGPYLARVELMKNKVTLDFKAMSTSVGSGRPRKIKREWKHADWLSNSYFFEAFTSALREAGITIETPPQEMFDFRYVQDFRNVQNDGRKMSRGGKEYLLPTGWKRFAVNVKGQYDEGDNKWLREDDENGWAVAYHGTSAEGLPGILSTGFRVGERQKFADDTGTGIYCAPEIEVAQHYSKPKMLKGHGVQIVLQLRVKPESIRPVTKPDAHEFEKRYWVINKPGDIRAYGVLIREMRMKDYVYPEFKVYGKDHPALKDLKKQYEKEVKEDEAAYARSW